LNSGVTDGALPGSLPLDFPLASLALVLAAALCYRLADLSGWRRNGRLGSIAAGLLLGGGSAIILYPLWLGAGAHTALTASAAFEAALLPPLAALLIDGATGLAAAGAAAVVLLMASLGLAWPPALLLLLIVGAGQSVIRAELEPFAAWLGWPWAKPQRTATPFDLAPTAGGGGIGLDPARDPYSAAEWRACLLALLPALLLLPVLAGARPAAILIALAAVALHIPIFWAVRRLVLGDWPAAVALPTDLIAGAEENRASMAPLLARIIAELPEGIAVFDGSDRLLACNGQYRALNRDLAADLEPGALYADLLRAEWERRADRTDADGAPAVAEAMSRHRNLPWREERPRPDGSWVQILEQRVADGGTLRIMRDITAIKLRELQFAELAQRNAVLASTVASVTSGIVICDALNADQPVVFANAAFTRITGYSAAEALGRNLRFLQGRDTDRDTVEKMRRAIATGRAITVTVRNYRKDGRTFWNEVNISPLRDESGRLIHFVGILQDVTNRIRTEEHLREAKDQAEVANRAKSEFLASVSHELRTPLNAILGFTEIMQLELFGPLGAPQYQSYAKDVHDSGQLLLDIINDILDLSKIEAGRMELFPEPVAASDAFDACLRLVAGKAHANAVVLKAELDPDLPPLLVDPRAVRQMLTNLLTNAVKFTPKGGRVTLQARMGEDDRIELAVIDTGIGIAPQDIAKVLEPFGQADNPLSRRQQGTGLGLPIVKALVEQSGGSFQLESAVGQGTRVTLRLPAVNAGKEAPRSAARS